MNKKIWMYLGMAILVTHPLDILALDSQGIPSANRQTASANVKAAEPFAFADFKNVFPQGASALSGVSAVKPGQQQQPIIASSSPGEFSQFSGMSTHLPNHHPNPGAASATADPLSKLVSLDPSSLLNSYLK